MGIFGNDSEQDARLDEIERAMRRVTEQVGELSIDLSVTRIELLKTRMAVGDSVKTDELDPVFGELNESFKTTRAQLEESKAAADEAWAMVQNGSDEALQSLRTGIDGAWARLDETSSS